MAGEAVYSSRWAVATGANPTFNGSSVRWDFKSDTLRKRQPWLRTPSLRGSRARIGAQGRRGPYTVEGRLTIDPSPKFLGWALPLVMGGGTETAPAFADALPEFAIVADRGTGTATAFGNCYKYLGLKMNRLALSGRGGLIECGIDLLGKTSTENTVFAGAALGNSTNYSPYQHADVTCQIADESLTLIEWDLTFNNNCIARWGTGTLSADEILEGPREITFTGTAACNIAGFDADLAASETGGNLVITNAGLSTTFNFNLIHVDLDEIQISGQELLIPISATIVGTTGVEMTVANDVTP
jgi:hypothetical protein